MTVRFPAAGRAARAVLLATALITVSSTPSAGAGRDAILFGAGDIARCDSQADDKVGALIAARRARAHRGLVFTLGDNVYPRGSLRLFRKCYEPAWGSFKHLTRPSPGNHDYLNQGAQGYYDYFGTLAGPERRGYYAYWRGSWRIYSLNSEVITQEQLDWLQEDLATKSAQCVLAYFHQPLFSSRPEGGIPEVRPFWDLLHAAGADVILSGHAHNYERFAPQTPDGTASEAGIRQFVVGTGGAALRDFGEVAANSEVRQSQTWGALKLKLGAGSYTWRFLRAKGAEFRDSGTGMCH